MNEMKYTEISFSEVQPLIENNVFIIVTATEVETKVTHSLLKSHKNFDSILKVHRGNITYFLGIFGNYSAVHIQCSMGSISRDSSIITVTEALSVIKPKLVLMPGIAFGVDESKQRIGDVLLAELVYPYNFKRVGTETIHRGVPLPASKILVSRFKSITVQWNFLLEDGKQAALIPCHILSGEELIDDKDYRDHLVEEFKSVKGGEMEGAGVYAACNDVCPHILVKGICDFADGKKGTNKEANQLLAISSSLSACLEVFSSTTAFDTIQLYPVLDLRKIHNNILKNTNSVLFDIYEPSKENYYIIRKDDEVFANHLAHYSIWIHGASGNGKSNLIIRNLSISDRKYVYISLAYCIGETVDSFFIEILNELARVNNENVSDFGTFKKSSQELISLLIKHYSDTNAVIFIEEIPISDNTQVTEFMNKMFSLIIEKMRYPSLINLKIVLSSIDNPQKFLLPFQQKINQHIKFIELKNWLRADVESLILMIENELNFFLDIEVRESLINETELSPRFIKKFFRNMIASNCFTKSDMMQMIGLTKTELN